MQVHIPNRIVSGGQTGVDQAALYCARSAGIKTGGFAPAGWRTENGPNAALRSFGLTVTQSSNYAVRTELNVKHSDATLILSDNAQSRGTTLTVHLARKLHKPYIVISPYASDALPKIKQFLNQYQPGALNIAGNRESISPGIQRDTHALLSQIFVAIPVLKDCVSL